MPDKQRRMRPDACKWEAAKKSLGTSNDTELCNRLLDIYEMTKLLSVATGEGGVLASLRESARQLQAMQHLQVIHEDPAIAIGICLSRMNAVEESHLEKAIEDKCKPQAISDSDVPLDLEECPAVGNPAILADPDFRPISDSDVPLDLEGDW